MTRRAALALVLAGLVLTASTILISRRIANSDSVVDPGFAKGAYPILVPDLCQAATELREGHRTDAYNSFYRRAHPALHALAADVAARGPSGRTESGLLRRAKSKVEAGLLNNSPNLGKDLSDLIDRAGASLIAIRADKNLSAPVACR